MDLRTSSTTYSFADDAPTSLALTNHTGDVVVLPDAPPGTAEVTLRADRPVDFEPVTATCHHGRVSVDIPALLSEQGGRGFAFSLGPISIGVGNIHVDVEVHVPPGADVSVTTRQGDIVLEGELGTTQLRSGSGDVVVGRTASLRASTGSGDVSVEHCTGGAISTGSGDITLGTAAGPDALEIRSGSGDISLHDNQHDATLTTGSGDITGRHQRGSFSARTGSGDVALTLPRGIPVWLDLSSGMGEVLGDLESLGAPAEGQEHLSVTVRTGTGDIMVRH